MGHTQVISFIERTLDNLYHSIEQCEKNDNWNEVITIAQHIIKIDNGQVHAYRYIAFAHFKLDDFNESINWYKAMLNVKDIKDGDISSAYYGIGAVYKKMSNFSEAENCFKKCVEISQHNADAFYALGSLYEMKDENQSALLYYKKANEINPQLSIPHTCISSMTPSKKDADIVKSKRYLKKENKSRIKVEKHLSKLEKTHNKKNKKAHGENLKKAEKMSTKNIDIHSNKKTIDKTVKTFTKKPNASKPNKNNSIKKSTKKKSK